MKRALRVFAIMSGLALVASTQAQAQMLKWTDRVFLDLNYVTQPLNTVDVANTSTFSIYDETGTASSTQSIAGKKDFVEFTVGARVFGNFGIGVAYSQFSTTGNGSVKVTAPHPIYYEFSRNGAGEVGDLGHKEQMIHIMGVFVLPLTNRFDVAVSAGPTIFKVEQDMLGLPQWSEVGTPFVAIQVTQAPVTTITKSKVGFNVGADVNFRIVKYVGVGAFARYASGTIPVAAEGLTSVDLKVGGFQAGGGLRIRF
jgi:hypothetical protein